MNDMLGIYIHIPFCGGAKCPYCDFYSVPFEKAAVNAYMDALAGSLSAFSVRARERTVDTVYFGGGTPSVLGTGLARMLKEVRTFYDVASDAEITFEANPGEAPRELFAELHGAGFNRVSLGLQSGSGEELKRLGRRHTPQDAARAVNDARTAGFENISLDLMLATPGQTIGSLKDSVDFAVSLGPAHISAYLLKIEPGTRFAEIEQTLGLPDNDTQADFYIAACDALEIKGFEQYEISNFAKPGMRSRHNLKYWNCDEYLGFGPGAHSYFGGRRFHYERNLKEFVGGTSTVDDGPGGDLSEYVMLRLRVREGVSSDELKRRYGVGFEIFDGSTVSALMNAGYVAIGEGSLHLTPKGCIVSNAVILSLLYKNNAMFD